MATATRLAFPNKMGEVGNKLNQYLNGLFHLIQHLTPAATVRGRFAPSPSGPLHFGSVLAALGSWLLAKQSGGEWWIRVEDVDRDRCRFAHEQTQLADLAILGLHSDGPVVRQSERAAHFQAALEQLLAGGHAFECRCSRAEVAAMGGTHHRCLDPLRTGPASMRLRVLPGTVIRFRDRLLGELQQDVYVDVGDFTLRRADGQWTYQMAVVVDDALQGMTQVVRGADLLESTARQIYLQSLLGVPTPEYAHLPLQLDRNGRKLSKRDEDPRAIDPQGAPITVLQRAWLALGQRALTDDVSDTPSAAAFLERARDHFDESLIPR